jgi:hypothetical protein
VTELFKDVVEYRDTQAPLSRVSTKKKKSSQSRRRTKSWSASLRAREDLRKKQQQEQINMGEIKQSLNTMTTGS